MKTRLFLLALSVSTMLPPASHAEDTSLIFSTPPTTTEASAARGSENILVREDRVWEREGRYGNTWTEWFEGTTEINGITYHNLHVRATSAKGETSEFIESYMREENGRVYSITAPDCKSTTVFGAQTVLVFDKEALAYDFNASAGDIIYRFDNPDDCIIGYGGDRDGTNRNANTLPVVESFREESCGRVYDVNIISDNSFVEKAQAMVVKGVGDLRTTLAFPVLHNIFDCPGGEVTATVVRDGNNNVIYDSSDRNILSVNDIADGQEVVVAGGHVFVTNPAGDTEVVVYDISGNIMKTTSGTACADTDLTSLGKGIYIVRITGGKTIASRKVIL